MIRKPTLTALLLAGLGASLATPATAAEPALYAAAPPDDAAFVRWLDEPAAYKAFGHDFDAAGNATDFRYFPARDGASVGGRYSFVAMADGALALVEEPGRDDATKVHIVLVNATAAPVRLVVAGKGAVVIDATAPQAAGMRGVNPVKAVLAVESADGARELGRFETALRRGQDITIVAREGGVEIVEDRLAGGVE